MRKILLSVFSLLALMVCNKTTAQCDLQFANLVITPAADPVVLGASKCEYKFNASFDIVTNSGFKYLFFHSWLAPDYPSPAIFDCGNSNAQNPGTSAELGTAVDDVGKSFLDIGFLNLNTVTFPANTPVNVTANFAASYPHDGTVVLTKPSNSPGLNAVVTRKGSTDTLHFEVTNIKIIVNIACGAPIVVKTDIWGSNSNAPDPKAQCYICGLTQSFNDPAIALQKICINSPFKFAIGLTTGSATDIHVLYRIYADDLDGIKEPGGDDALVHTSDTIVLNSSTPYSSGPINLPHPYCCLDPWAQYGIFAEVTGREFSNVLGTPVIEEVCATLPIKLRSFTATRYRDKVTLKWETEIEENNRGFDVQRKVGNGMWQSLGFVDSKAFNGNSSIPLSYEFGDINNTKGISQYRLKQTDFDGTYSFSPIRSVRGDGQKTKTIIYPNPSADGKVNVVFEDVNAIRDVSLMDMHGRVIRQWKAVSNNTIQIDNLAPGFYTIRIINTNTREQSVEKFVVKNR
jgi:hypothetical protein